MKGQLPTAEVKRENEDVSAWEALIRYLRRRSVLLSVLATSTLVLYSGALFFDFVWDDRSQIVNNPILRSWHNLPRAFTSDLWFHVARHQVYYRPLFVAWSMLNYALFGLHPWGWHLGAILAHIAAVAAVFWFAQKLGLEYLTAALAALIFAIHPIHIEPVVWISAASDTMVTVFVLIAFVAFLNGRDPSQRSRTSWWLASLVLLACALLVKEMAVTFSGLVAIYAWLHPQRQDFSQRHKVVAATREAVPYALVTVAYAALRKHALMHATGQFDPGHGIADVVKTLPLVVSFYLKKLFLPIGLTGLYFTPYVTGNTFTQVILPTLALSAIAALLWWWNRREPNCSVAFVACWFVISLAPALWLRNFGNGDFVRDRYVYLPSVGFSILSALACSRIPSIKQWSAKAVQLSVVGALCIAYFGVSLAQQVYWANDFLLLVRGQSLYPDNPFTMASLAAQYSQLGANEKAIKLAEEAAIRHPEYPYGALALAEAYIRAGRFDDGRIWLQRVNPEYAQSETGVAEFASLYGRMGDYDKALDLCSEILAKEPDLYSAIYNCGNIHLMTGQYHDAERLLVRATQLAPELPGPKHYLGRALLADAHNNEAQPYLRQAVALDNNVWDYHYWLGVSLEKSGDIRGARAEYQEALRLNVESTDAKQHLAALNTR
ncbi:MAG: tetratricopeptide repeat protein [Terriglobales bacterium]